MSGAMSILRKIFGKVNGLLRRSYWVNEVMFPDCKSSGIIIPMDWN